MKLTKEEKEILDSVENEEWERVPDFDSKAAKIRPRNNCMNFKN